jgi:hypothetical protein
MFVAWASLRECAPKAGLAVKRTPSTGAHEDPDKPEQPDSSDDPRSTEQSRELDDSDQD